MKSKVALLLANGFEEIEALTVVDVLRRAEIDCDMISINDSTVSGSHGITVTADKLFDEGSILDYDVLVLPGGMPGSVNLRDDVRVIEAVKKFNDAGKMIAAICAAPMVLYRAGVLNGKRITCFPGVEKNFDKISYIDDIVVEHENIITSRGPAATIYFALKLVEKLAENTVQTKIKEGMQLKFIEEQLSR